MDSRLRFAGAALLGGAGVPLAYAGVDAVRDAADNALDPEPQEAGYGYERRSPLEEALMGALSVAGGTAGAAIADPQHALKGLEWMMNNRVGRRAVRMADRPLRVLERMGTTPEQRGKMGVNRILAQNKNNGHDLTDDQQRIMDAIGVNPGAVAAAVADGDTPRKLLYGALKSRLEDGRLSPEAVYALGASVSNDGTVSGREDMIGVISDSIVRTIGVPVGAHAAIAGGSIAAAALGVKGALDVYARMQAGEEVSEEEAAAAMDVVESVSGGRK
jgi:hypothetical protein